MAIYHGRIFDCNSNFEQALFTFLRFAERTDFRFTLWLICLVSGRLNQQRAQMHLGDAIRIVIGDLVTDTK